MQLNPMKTESNLSVKRNEEGKYVNLYKRKTLSFWEKIVTFNKNRNTKKIKGLLKQRIIKSFQIYQVEISLQSITYLFYAQNLHRNAP